MLSLILLLACSGKDAGENTDDTATTPTDQDSGADEGGGTSGGADDTAVPPDGPHVVGLRVLPEEPYTDDDLECVWDEIVDADSATVSWFINKNRLDVEGAVLPSDNTHRGQIVSCEVTPDAEGAYTDFYNVNIKNTKPVVTDVVLVPEVPTENDSVILAEIEFTDIDEDPARVYDEHFTWFVNDEEVAYDEPALGRSYWEKGDEVKVRAYVRDQGNSNTEWSETATIGNAPPTAPEVRFTGGEDGAPLTCEVSVPSEDADGDPLTYSHAWRRFGLSVSLALSCSSDGSACTLEAPEAGASYTCEVTPSDGTDRGDSALTIGEIGGDVLRYLWLWDEPAAQAASRLLVGEDIDGDGRKDILVGAPRASLSSTNGGAVLELLSGSFGDESLVDDAVGRIVFAEGTEVRMGNALGWLPDVDGDGIAELITGAPNYDRSAATNSGAALVFYSDSWGSDDERSDEDYDLAYFGFESDEQVGQAVATADLNEDGLPELIVGAPGRYDLKDVAGGVIFFPGSKVAAGGELNAFSSEGSGSLLGEGEGEGSGLLAVDLDGDGVKDLLVQAQDAGTISAVLSPELQSLFSDDPKGFAELGSLSDRATYVLTGDASDHAGDSMVEVALADGSTGVLIGAPDAGDGGAAYLWSASDGSGTLADLTARFEGVSNEELGASVAVLGRTGGPTGETWLAFGAPDDGTTYNGAGAVYVVGLSDWTGGLTTDDSAPVWSAVYGESANSGFGSAVAGPGDWDDDGRPDLAVGLPKVDSEVGFDVGGVVIWTDYLP